MGCIGLPLSHNYSKLENIALDPWPAYKSVYVCLRTSAWACGFVDNSWLCGRELAWIKSLIRDTVMSSSS